MDMQRLLILRGLPEALKAFRSDKDFEGRLVEALRTHLSAGPRDSLYYQDRGTEDGQAFVIYLFNRADPSAPGIPIYPGDENMYRVPYAVTPGGALEFSFGPPEKVRERRDYVPEGEIAKAGPLANAPGLALDPTSHRWKKTGGARPGLTLNKESREIVHHDEAPNDAAAAAYEHQQAAAGHAEKVDAWVKKSRDWPRRDDGSPVNATAYKKNQRHSDKHGEAWAAHHNAMTGHLHGSAAPGESDHAREKSKHADEWSAANGFGPAEALKAKAKGDNLTLDMFGGGAPPAAAKPTPAPGLMEPRKGEAKAKEHDAQRQAHLDAAAGLSGSPLGSPGHALHSDHMHAANMHELAAKEHRGFADEGVKNAASAKARAASAHVGATPGDPTHGGRLVAQKVTDKAGHQTTRYKKTGEAAHPLAHLQKLQPGDQTTVNGVRLHVSTPIGHGTVPHIHDTEAGRELGPLDDPKTLDKVAEHVQKPRDTIPGTPESIRKMTSAMGPKVTMPNGETVQRVSVSNPGEAHSRAMSQHRERGDQHRQAAIAAEDRGDQAAADAHYAAWDAHDAAASAHGTAAQHATTSTDEAAVSRSRASSSAAAEQAAKAESASAAAAALDKGGTASAPPKPPATTPASPPAPASPPPSQDPDGFEALHPKSKEVFNAAFSSKDPAALSSMLHADNKRLRAEFSRRTGVKLPSTVKGTREAIHQWAATAATDTPVKVKDAQAGAEHKIPSAPAKARGKAETEALATATKAGPVADGTADWQMSDAHHAASQRHLAAARALYDAADKVKDPTEMKALGDAHNAAAEAHIKARKQHDADSRKDSSPEGERLTKIANEASAAAAAAHPEAKARALHGLHPNTAPAASPPAAEYGKRSTAHGIEASDHSAAADELPHHDQAGKKAHWAAADAHREAARLWGAAKRAPSQEAESAAHYATDRAKAATAATGKPAAGGPPPALSLAEGHAAAAKQHQDKADWHNQAAKTPGAATKHETARGLHQAAADWHTAASKAPQGSPEYERAAKLARQSEHEAKSASDRAPAQSPTAGVEHKIPTAQDAQGASQDPHDGHDVSRLPDFKRDAHAREINTARKHEEWASKMRSMNSANEDDAVASDYRAAQARYVAADIRGDEADKAKHRAARQAAETRGLKSGQADPKQGKDGFTPAQLAARHEQAAVAAHDKKQKRLHEDAASAWRSQWSAVGGFGAVNRHNDALKRIGVDTAGFMGTAKPTAK